MEVKPGYKRTALGVIPEEWQVKSLSKIVERLDAGVSVNSVEGGVAAQIHSQCVLKTSAVAEGRFFPDECKKIAQRDLSRISLRPRADTIILSRMNTPDLVGECGYVEVDYENLYLPDRLWMTKQRTDSDASVRWLSYLLSSRPQKSRIKELATGTSGSMKNLAKGSLLELEIVVPSLSEQRAIAAALSDVDALLAALDRLIAKKRDLKQAAMQQLLTGQTRLPGFRADWNVRSLGKIAAIRNEKINTLGAEVAAFCVELEQVGQNNGRIDGYSDARLRQSVKYRFEQGDVLFGRLRPYLRKFWRADREGVCSTEIWPLVPINGQLVSAFLFQIVQSDAFIEAANSSYGTHMPRSDWKALIQFEILVPSDPDEQTTIAAILSEMDAEIMALEQRRDKTRALKQGMMQELLTGRTRLA